MKIYGFVHDCGDGSSSIAFVQSRKLFDRLMEDNPVLNGINEGIPSVIITVDSVEQAEKMGIDIGDETWEDYEE